MTEEKRRIEIGMMKIMPIFDVPAWEDIEKRLGSLDEAIASLRKEKGWQRATIAAATILCNRALEIAGDKPITEAYAARMIRPIRAGEVRNACLFAIAEGMRTEHRGDAEDEPVDLVLREIEKKQEPAE